VRNLSPHRNLDFRLFTFSHLFSPRLFPLLICLLGITPLIACQTTRPASADADFVEEFRGVGTYGYVANGIGTRGDPVASTWTGEGSFDLTIPATATIEKARLIWTGRSNAYDADGVILSINGVNQGVQTADLQYEQDPWCCNAQQRHESADITALIQTGTHTYTISDHEHGLAPDTDNLNYGVGIWVVYEDASEPFGEVIVYQGQDSFFRNWDPERGPHTEVRCATFTADTAARTAEMIHLVSGIDTHDPNTNAFRARSVAFWHEVGNGPMPPPDETPNLTNKIPTLSTLNRPTATGFANGTFPMQSYAGLEWDNFEMTGGLTIPANDSWACFQIESGDEANLSGLVPNPATGPLEASGMWNLFMMRIPLPQTTAVSLTRFDAQRVQAQTVQLAWDTAVEIDNYGFNLYRSPTPNLTDASYLALVPASTTPGVNTYTYQDSLPGFGTWYYWLEDIDTDGTTTLHGPISISVLRQFQLFLPMIR
jgi:hypothetical protein